jgi:hypothetical protein
MNPSPEVLDVVEDIRPCRFGKESVCRRDYNGALGFGKFEGPVECVSV